MSGYEAPPYKRRRTGAHRFLKDRAIAIAVVKAREKEAEVITMARTGNAAAALAGICATIGQPNVILVPETAPPVKMPNS